MDKATEYISKAEVLELLESYSLGQAFRFGHRSAEADAIAKEIKGIYHSDVAPTIYARWIDNKRGGYKWAFYCSRCGWIDGYPFNDRFKYCPNCGAKMDESENEE